MERRNLILSLLAGSLLPVKYLFAKEEGEATLLIGDEKLTILERDGNRVIRHKIENDKIVRYFKNGVYHREDGPAHYSISKVGDNKTFEEWYWEGKLHRDGGPAGTANHAGSTHYVYYQHGVLHREDGPANCWSNGQEKWYKHGKQHRVDGPASIIPIQNGVIKSWWIEDQLHREDGPAMEAWIDGMLVDQEWYWKDKLHRENGPAKTKTSPNIIIYTYYKHGELTEETFRKE